MLVCYFTYYYFLLTGGDGRHILSAEEFPTTPWAKAHRVLIPGAETGEKAPIHLSVENEERRNGEVLLTECSCGKDGWMDERTTLKLYRLKTVSWTCPWHQHWSEAVKHARQGRWLADEVWGAWPVRVPYSIRSRCVCVCVCEILKSGKGYCYKIDDIPSAFMSWYCNP